MAEPEAPRQYPPSELADMARRISQGEPRASVMRHYGVKSPQRFRLLLKTWGAAPRDASTACGAACDASTVCGAARSVTEAQPPTTKGAAIAIERIWVRHD